MFDYYTYPSYPNSSAAEAAQAATKATISPNIANPPLSSAHPHPHAPPSFSYPHIQAHPHALNLPHSNIPPHFPYTYSSHYNNPSLYNYRNRCGRGTGRRIIFPLLIVGGVIFLYKGIKRELGEVREEILVNRDISIYNSSNNGRIKVDDLNAVEMSGVGGIENEREKMRRRWGWNHRRQERDSFIQPLVYQQNQHQSPPPPPPQLSNQERRI